MSSFSEQDPLDPDDPVLDYRPLRLSERAAKLGPSLSQEARSEVLAWVLLSNDLLEVHTKSRGQLFRGSRRWKI